MTLVEQLDFIHLPSRDVAADIGSFTDTLRAKLAPGDAIYQLVRPEVGEHSAARRDLL